MPKKKTAIKRSTGGKKKDILVVASKVKAYAKSKKMNTSSDAIARLSDQIYMMIDSATDRSKANGRKTIKTQDI